MNIFLYRDNQILGPYLIASVKEMGAQNSIQRLKRSEDAAQSWNKSTKDWLDREEQIARGINEMTERPER